jgi:hypothetical protein
MRKRLLIAAVLGILGCGGGPTVGDITFQLGTPNGDDGAIQFRLASTMPNTLQGVTAVCTGCKLFREQVSDTELVGIITGDLSSGDILRVTVSDVGAAGYTGTVVAVASRSYQVRSPSGYSLTLPASGSN